MKPINQDKKGDKSKTLIFLVLAAIILSFALSNLIVATTCFAVLIIGLATAYLRVPRFKTYINSKIKDLKERGKNSVGIK